ncbi:hypothetical protein L7F22_054092 [Adiantum nelumboides]|nr:hypothetical protein [Adiantum nelumboides]
MVKGMESADELAAKKVALHMVANNARIQQYSDRKVAKALGIQPRNSKKHRAGIQAKTFKWVGEGCKLRADCLSEEGVHSIIQFWTSNTRVSPNKKDICRQRISQNNYRFHPSHYLELTEAKFFMNFKEKHLSIDIGFCAFQSLKPFFVRKLKERNTCQMRRKSVVPMQPPFLQCQNCGGRQYAERKSQLSGTSSHAYCICVNSV